MISPQKSNLELNKSVARTGELPPWKHTADLNTALM